MNRICAVFGGGDPVSSHTAAAALHAGAYLIAADSGYLLMQRLGLEPDLIIGDFDSAPEPDFHSKRVYPVEKDDTDLMLAVKEGLSAGCREFRLFGVTGGRLDHTYAAIQSLAYLLDSNAAGEIISDNEIIRLIDPGEYFFPAMEGYTLSLFAYSESVEGLSISGAKYPADGITLKSSFPLGVSNLVSGSQAAVSFKEGRLLVIRSKL